MKFIPHPWPNYQHDKLNVHYEEDVYQVINRMVNNRGDNHVADITFCGSDKEARLLCAAQEMQQLLDQLVDAGQDENKIAEVKSLWYVLSERIDNG